MSFLQEVVTPELKSTGGHEIIFYIEIGILIAVFILQLYHFLKVRQKIIDLREIFKTDFKIGFGKIEKNKINLIDDDSSEFITWISNDDAKDNRNQNDTVSIIPLLEIKTHNKINARIREDINKYLINNYGATVNYSILRDIVDREVDVRDEEISQSVTTPLYFGLAATIVGIICGLLAMPDLKTDSNLDAINYLIDGVKWAMGTSLIGLGLTTWLSSFTYKSAKSEVLNGKNRQLSYLQAKLLPELIKAEDTAVTGLKASLDRFARVATKISDDVLIAANQTGENLTIQQEIIEKFERTGIQRISKANLDLFDKLERNMDTFEKFASYVDNMERISMNLLEFGKRTSNIDSMITSIDSNLSDAKKINQFLSEHFKKIEGAGDAAMKAVGLAEVSFEGAIDILRKRVTEMIDSFNKLNGVYEIQLEKMYQEMGQSIINMTSQYIKVLSEAYTNSIPRFEQLDNLKYLPEIKNDVSTKADVLKNQNEIRAKTMLENLEILTSYLKEMQSNNQSMLNGISTVENTIRMNNQVLLEKLTSFDEKLNHKPIVRKPNDPDKRKSGMRKFYNKIFGSRKKVNNL